VEEASRPGRLRNEIVDPMVRRNVHALREAGLHIPMKAMAVIKSLPIGSAFTFSDGTSLLMVLASVRKKQSKHRAEDEKW
jgi:hypothetical protein